MNHTEHRSRTLIAIAQNTGVGSRVDDIAQCSQVFQTDYAYVPFYSFNIFCWLCDTINVFLIDKAKSVPPSKQHRSFCL